MIVICTPNMKHTYTTAVHHITESVEHTITKTITIWTAVNHKCIEWNNAISVYGPFYITRNYI